MFQFRPFPTYDYFIHRTLLWYCHSGFPHSEISGSKLICSYPKLIAACRVLHRLLMPRHSPCALISLTYRPAFAGLLRKANSGSHRVFRIMQALELTKLSCFTLLTKSSTINVCFPLLLALHTLVTLFSFQGAVPASLKPDSSTQLPLNT